MSTFIKERKILTDSCILRSHLTYPLFQITGLIYFINIWLVNSIRMVELLLMCKQEMVSLTYSGSRVYGKQLKMGFMNLSQTRELSAHMGEMVWKSKHSQAKNVFWFLSAKSKFVFSLPLNLFQSFPPKTLPSPVGSYRTMFWHLSRFHNNRLQKQDKQSNK